MPIIESAGVAGVLSGVRKGRVYDLGVPLKNFMPHAPLHPPFIFAQWAMHGDYHNGSCTPSNDLIVMGGHVGTHVDALGHIAREGRLYGGAEASEVQHGQLGLSEGGVDQIPPVIRRGVLLDVAGHLGVERMEPNQPVGAELLEAVAEGQGVEVGEGDVVLVRTGWIQTFEDGPTFVGDKGGCPGVDLDGARWVSGRGAYMTGADTLAYEVWPSHELPVHAHLIPESGIPIIEMLDLEELAADGVHEFAFVMIPLNIKGGTASPVRPLALV
ncbi:putative cyclase [Rubrobacter xylanophilus DSM 9941]|uniref:Putative cyclase n=1 Tax=Rubrobacter xylanophilus (strain DSM 9941 / JCM 11954 / NBRC 16129 / PRD-1) TaxID=266117 RepID=Q1AZ50_RUBXD|nr:cyclase family protein [Rubrobacter xylanophilus]ABG03328.1 putative cyclase [Rubrobacter xylanophilus DSM 9941]